MSLFGSIGSALKGAVGGFLTGGPAGAVIGGAAGLSGLLSGPRKLNSSVGSGLAGLPVLPGVGRVLAPVVGGAVGSMVLDQFGRPVKRKRRRAKGITASELKGFKRVACVLNQYQKVAVAKKVKCPPKRRSMTCK